MPLAVLGGANGWLSSIAASKCMSPPHRSTPELLPGECGSLGSEEGRLLAVLGGLRRLCSWVDALGTAWWRAWRISLRAAEHRRGRYGTFTEKRGGLGPELALAARRRVYSYDRAHVPRVR